jgi:predicted GH43/DUF377 family glycosyl hydrolase
MKWLARSIPVLIFLAGALGLAGFRLRGPDAPSCASDGNTPYRVERSITGNYELKLETGEKVDGPMTVYFSAAADRSTMAFLRVSKDHISLGRKIGDSTATWKEYSGPGEAPWKVSLLKKGNFFRFQVNQVTGWIRGPMGEWDLKYDPWTALVGVEAPAELPLKSFNITTLPWLQQLTQPVLPKGPPGSFYEAGPIPGALLEIQGTYYMYFVAHMTGDQEGASRRSVGVAMSKDLRNWTVHPEPVISYKDFPYDNLYVNGAVMTPERKVAVMFSAQVFPEWKGFMLVTADGPLGPFKAYEHNPAYKHFTHAHEFDLVRVDRPDYRYIMFYSGFTPHPRTGPAGDRGYLLYSNDLMTWRADSSNPVFSPQTLDDWDAVHIRPRSLTKIGDTWYLWYEGCNNWAPPNSKHHGWWDTVGLARSKDLLHWEYYPRNPALPGLSADAEQFDNKWVGWPRMYVKGDTGYVFYTGGSPDKEGGIYVGLRTIALKDLTNWESEGGKTFDLLHPERTEGQ